MVETSFENQTDTEQLMSESETDSLDGIEDNQCRIPRNVLMKWGFSVIVLVFLVATLATLLALFLRIPGNKIPECPLSSMNSDDLNNAVDSWAKQIDSKNCAGIYNILSECKSSNMTRLLISESVKTAYNGSLANFPAVLNFVREMNSFWDQYTGYAALQATMHKFGDDHSKEMINLVYFIKITIENNSIGPELAQKYTDLLKLVPESIHLIVIEQCVSIKNKQYDEYLFLSNITAKSQRLVMSWTGLVKDLSKFQQAFWHFQADFENKELFFRIRNDYYGDNSTICPSIEQFDMQRGNTVECPNDHKLDSRWVVTPVDKKGYFTIMSGDDNLLFSPNDTNLYDSNRRYTFTWLGPWSVISGHPSSYWSISRCP